MDRTDTQAPTARTTRPADGRRTEAPPPAQAPLPGSREQKLAGEPSPVRRFLKLLGPGLITGASDDDPTAIATYSSAGARFGYGTLWTALFTFPMMAGVQYICAKVGLVTGTGLAGVLRRHYPRGLVYPAIGALLLANVITIGADIGAVAAGINLLVPVRPAALVLPVTLLILGLLVVGNYRVIANTFKWVTLTLFAYVGAAVLAKPDWGEALRDTLVPQLSLDPKFLAILVAIVGTNISPYLSFWQSSQEVEEKIAVGQRRLWQRRGTTDSELRYAAWDTTIGMFFSQLVVFFINLAAAAALFAAGQHDVTSAADAARALGPLAGDGAFVLFALGMIGSGFLAIPVLAGSSAFALAEAFGWTMGLEQRATRAWQFYLVIFVSMIIGTEINYVGLSPMDALVWAAALNGVLAAPLLVLIMLVANNRGVMGSRVNGIGTNLIGWITTLAMAAAAAGLLLTWGH